MATICYACGKENSLGKTPFCPYCGAEKPYGKKVCPYYYEHEVTRTLSDFERGYLLGKTGERRSDITEVKGECWGAGPEIEYCNCGGNMKECPRHKEK